MGRHTGTGAKFAGVQATRGVYCVHHLAGNGKHLVGGNRPEQETHIFPGIESGVFAVAAEHENRHRGKTRCQFSHEGGAAHSGPVESDDDQAQFLSKIGLFHQDEGFRRVGRALDGAEMALQNGPANVCLQRVVVDQKNRCHLTGTRAAHAWRNGVDSYPLAFFDGSEHHKVAPLSNFVKTASMNADSRLTSIAHWRSRSCDFGSWLLAR